MNKFGWHDKKYKISSIIAGKNLKKIFSLGVIFLLITSIFLTFHGYGVFFNGVRALTKEKLQEITQITTLDIEQAIDNGIKWLANKQEQDGGWPAGGYGSSRLYNTWWSMLAFRSTQRDVKYSSLISKALDYIENQEADPFVIQLLILYGFPVSDPKIQNGVNQILKTQNQDGSWGKNDNGEWTAHYVWALSLAGYSLNSDPIKKALDYIFYNQRNDGSWILTWTGRGDPLVTGQIITFLLLSGVSASDTRVQKAINYIKSKQANNGGWQSSDGYFYIETTARALCALALSGENFNSEYIQKGLKFLLTYRNPDGSFHNWVGNSTSEIYVTGDVIFTLGIVMYGPIKQVKTPPPVQEFWVPLVFSKAWSGDFGHSIEIYKIEDSEYFVERGSLNNFSIGTHIVVTKGSIMASYFWLNNDLGAWDDDVLGYTILPSSKLGTEYLIPVGGTVLVVATQPYTTVSYKGGGSPKILVDAGSYFQFVSSDGGWIKADKPVAVAVGNVDVKTKSDTYAYAPLPNNLLGTHYHFSKREPMDSYFKNQADLSKLVIMATEQGAKVLINGEALSLSAYGFKVIENPSENLKIISDKPISVVYLQRIRYTDPWTGDERYASYAYSLIPKSLWGTSYILFEGWKYHLITEETVNVQIGENPTRQYSAGVHDLGFQEKTSVIKSDKPINLVKIAIATWAGKYFPRGDGYEVFPMEFYTPFMQITISVEEPVPFDRLFSINLRVKNLNNTVISLKVALEERTGFQAGPKYGDGDEIKEITLNPGQDTELTFKAKVYGIQRIGDVARFKFYIGDKLIEQKDQVLNLKPEVVEVSTFTSPAAVKKGVSFTIGVPVFYSLSMDTVIALILINEENGKKIVISDVVKGEGLKIYSIRVNSTIADLNLEGIKSFKLTVQSEYPEENYRVAYKKEFSFKVRVSNDVGSSSIVVDSGFRIILNYKGKQYYALYAYNATPSQPSQFENIEDLFKHVYSRRNWLVFENIKGSFKPVMDDELYKTLAFAAEIAYLRATSWNNDYLVSRSKLFKELRDLAEVLETLNFIAKIAGKILGMIILKGANTWASSILAGTETTKMVYKITMIVKKFIDILKKLEFYEKVSEKFKEVAGKFEELLIRLSISYLNAASDFLIVAREKLPELTLTPYQSLVINVSDALTFYSFIQLGDTMGLAAMHFLSAFYGAEQVDIMGIKINLRPLKNALFEVLGVIPSVSSAIEFYDNLMNKFNVPEVFEIAQHMTTVWEGYELRKLICQSASLKFRDTYIRETSNSMEISLTEPATQRKLYLTVYDTEGRIVGFDRKSGNIVAGIPNSYYLDFGNAVIIYVPLNVKIEKIVVDAIKSEQPIENYSLMIQVYKEGNLVSSTSLSSQININTKKEYSLQLTGDLKPTLNELTTTPSPSPTITSPTQTQTPATSPSAAPLNMELIIIIIVIAATLASLVIVFRKYKTK
jgi:hypothetical protein